MHRTFRIVILIVCVQSLSHAPSYAASKTGMCTADEEVVWECPIKKKFAALCASKGAPSGTSTVQYRYGRPDKIELQFPSSPQPPAGRFYISSVGYSGGGEYHLRFSIADYDYILFERTVRTRVNGPNYPAMSEGIVIRYRGKVTSVLNCSKPPTGSISSGKYDAFMSKEEYQMIDELFDK